MTESRHKEVTASGVLGDAEPNIVWLCPNPECPPGLTKEDAVADVEETVCP